MTSWRSAQEPRRARSTRKRPPVGHHAGRRGARREQVEAAALPAHDAREVPHARCCSCRRSSTGTTCSICCPARASPSGWSRRGTTSTASTGARRGPRTSSSRSTRWPTGTSVARSARRVATSGRMTGKAHVLGYCMGGTLAAIHAAAHPERVRVARGPRRARALQRGGDAAACGPQSPQFEPKTLVDALGNVPWQLMQSSFHMLRPTHEPGEGRAPHRPRVGRRVPRRLPGARDLGQRQRELPRRGVAQVGRGAVPGRRLRARRPHALGPPARSCRT